jgi:tetratricopeptide (TPR) repeat protein
VINEFEAMTASYRRLYHRTAAEDVLDSLTEHVAGMERLLRQSRDTNNQQRPLWQRLAATGSEAALLAGRLRHFDLNQPDAARSDYQEAFHAARAADDPMLAASALGHASFIPTGDGDTATALRLLDDAHGLAEASGNPTIRAWVFAIQARTHAIAGSAGRTLTAIETAERILQTAADPASNPEWLDYFDRGRLGAFKGYCYLRLHRPADALTVLDEALEQLDGAAYKARACYLADIATASVQRGKLEQGCSIAGQAADLLVQTRYWIGLDRISQFRAQLADRKNAAPVRRFEDRLWELGLFWTDAQ